MASNAQMRRKSQMILSSQQAHEEMALFDANSAKKVRSEGKYKSNADAYQLLQWKLGQFRSKAKQVDSQRLVIKQKTAKVTDKLHQIENLYIELQKFDFVQDDEFNNEVAMEDQLA